MNQRKESRFAEPVGKSASRDNISENCSDEGSERGASRLSEEVIDFLPDAILAIDKEGKVLVWNRAMEKLTGVRAEDMIGKGDYEHALPFYGIRRPILADLVLMPADQVEGKYDSLERDGEVLTTETFIPSFGPSGSYIWAKASPLYDSRGELIGAIESIRDITSKKKIENKVCNMKRLLAEVIDFLPDATFSIDMDGKVITWNRAMEKMTGAKAEDMIGKGNYEYALPFYGVRRPILADLVLMPEDEVKWRYDFLKWEGKTLTVEIFIPTFGPNGSYLWAKATPLYGSTGQLMGAIESIRDITERKRAEEALQRSEQEKAAILGGLKNVAVEYLDPQMQIIWLNSAVHRHLGMTEEEVKGHDCFELIQGLKEPCPGCTAKKALQTGQSQDGELATPDGRFWVSHSSPIKDANQQVTGVVNVAVNITHLKRTEEKLKNIIDFLPDATLVINKEGEVIAWNRALEDLTGIDSAEMLGQGDYKYSIPFYGERRPMLIDLAIAADEDAMEKYPNIKKEGNTLVTEIWIPTFRGNGAHLWAKASPLYDSAGRLMGAIESIRDITEQKRNQEALQRSEQEKAAILGGLKNVAVEYLDPQMQIIWLNSAVQKHLGLREEETKGHDCFELIQGLKEPCPGCTAKKALQTGQSQDGELATPDGRIWVSRSSPIKDANQQVTGVVNVAVNITHLKRTEEKLKNIIDFLPDATLVINKEGEIIAWNRALEELTGVESAEMLGQGNYKYALPIYGERRPMLIDLAIAADEAVMKRYPSIKKEGSTLTTEVYIPTFRGRGAYLWAKATPLYDPSGKLLGAIESIRDMTGLREVEGKLERSKSELRIASDIQRSFLPEHIPPLNDFDMAATSIPAMEVGGDFYDFIPGDRRLGMVIADVSGKSIPAALFMALSRTIVRANATHHEKGTEVLQDANDMIAADSRSGMFVTLFYGVLDERSGTLIYANAGHPPPLLLRGDGKLEDLEVTGIALGAIGGVKYQERQIDILPGDIMVLYTDGVNEAINSREEQYGLDRLCKAVRRSRHLSASGIMENILQDISLFAGGQAQFDDITMIVVKAK